MLPFRTGRYVILAIGIVILVLVISLLRHEGIDFRQDSYCSRNLLFHGRVLEALADEAGKQSAYFVDYKGSAVAVITEREPPLPGKLIVVSGRSCPMNVKQVVVVEANRWVIPPF